MEAVPLLRGVGEIRLRAANRRLLVEVVEAAGNRELTANADRGAAAVAVAADSAAAGGKTQADLIR